jgi:ribosomal subunit interface protein
MSAEVRISFRGMEPSPAVEAKVQRRMAELAQLTDRITRCRVVLEAAHRRHHQGNIYQVSVDLDLPGGKILVNRAPAQVHAHEDMYVAVRDAFDSVRRRLQEHLRRQAG